MSDIQRYIESVKKLCRSIETDFDLGEYVRDMARTVFKETEDHAKAIAELESQLSDVRELLEFKRQAIEELEDAISRRDCDYFEDMEAKSKSIEELKAEIERLKGGWIDVNDRLPHKRTENQPESRLDPDYLEPPCVLLLFASGDKDVGYWDYYYDKGGSGYEDAQGCNAWVSKTTGEILELYYDKATHWQPLPPEPTDD